MGVPGNTLHLFILYQILLIGSIINGLPFASITSLPSLETTEVPPIEESLPASFIPYLVNIENLISSASDPGSSSNNFQLLVGLPIGSTNFILPQNPSNIDVLSANISSLTLPTSSNIQPNIVFSNPVIMSLSSEDVASTVAPHIPTTTSTSGVSTVPLVNVDQKTVNPVIQSLSSADVASAVAAHIPTTTQTSGVSTVPLVNVDQKTDNLKREYRDTLSATSQEPCLSITQQNLLESSPSGASKFPSSFSSKYLMSQVEPISPCVKMNLPQLSTQRKIENIENSRELDQLSNEKDFECKLSNPLKSLTSVTNISPGPTIFQNNLLCPQENSNMMLALNILNNGVAKQTSCEVSNAAVQLNRCPESSEIITLSEPLMKTYIGSQPTLQPCLLNTDKIQSQSNVKTNLSPTQMMRLNNNLINAKALQNNKMSSLALQDNIANCENIDCQSRDLMTEYENVLRIRNSVIPKMLSNNYLVRPKNNNDNLGCPQLKTVSVQDNAPCTQSSNILIKPPSNCDSENESSGQMIQNNNNQGCPQLKSIPVYSKDSLLNKLRMSNNNIDVSQYQNDNINLTPKLQNNYCNTNNNNVFKVNQNVQGCPQLLSIAQNNLYTMQNNDANINIQNVECENKLPENVNNNCIQTFSPNDNLAQALKLVNRAKTAQSPAATINILPYGETLLDGKPINNNLITLESIECPGQLPTCTCSGAYNSNNFLTTQDVSSMPFTTPQVVPFSYSTLGASVPIPTNVMLPSSFNPINNLCPITSNIASSVINLTPSVPIVGTAMTNTELPIANPPLFFSQKSSCNSNIQPMFTLLQTSNGMNPIATPNFIPVQSLPQVSFVNNVPSTSISVSPSSSYPDSCISSICNIPSSCTSCQPFISSSYPLTTNIQQASSAAGTSALYPSLNNIVSSLTRNILSKLISKSQSGKPLASLPPVNPFTPQLITETSPICSPVSLDISEPTNCIISSPISVPGLSISNIPVACNEYLPPTYSPTILPVSTFNPNLFYVEPDTAIEPCSPFALSKTDAFHPEVSFMLPSVESDCTCLNWPLFMPAGSLPQSPSVIKINNSGREAKGYEQLIK